MTAEQAPAAGVAAPVFVDGFDDDRRPGRVLGTAAGDGTRRLVLDAEGRVSIDHGALRFAPIRTAGWGREGVAYGPFERQAGAAFSVSLLNGHNGSHSGPIDGGLRRRFVDWMLGPRDRRAIRRGIDFVRSSRKAESWWLWTWWLRNAPRFSDGAKIDDNLAVGWFERPDPTDPLAQGSCLVVRTNGGETGQVVAAVRGADPVVVPVVANVPTSYLVVLGPNGAAYFGASIPGVAGLAASPAVRPLAIDRSARPEPIVYVGVHQSVLGQVGFSADTRVYRAAAGVVPAWADWWTTAHTADSLVGSGPLADQPAEHGGFVWRAHDVVGAERTPEGLSASGGGVVQVVPADPSGLVGVDVDVVDPHGRAGIAFRIQDDRHQWRLELDGAGARLCIVVDGESTVVAHDATVRLPSDGSDLLQLSDDGERISARFGGVTIMSPVLDDRLADARGVGVVVVGARTRVSSFEAHPRTITPPGTLLGPELASPVGRSVELDDDFSGRTGDLHGREVRPGVAWRREIGSGVIATSGDGSAAVVASVDQPNPGRTVYLLPWTDPLLADVDVEITPPGTGRGQEQRGRGGVVLWQDADHFVIINNWLDDTYPGASLSMFCRLGRFEEVFRAVWSNVGSRIDWGVPHRLRVGFDGEHLVARIDDVVVLYRAISDVHDDVGPLRISGVGIAANWEWGHDTGSVFNGFVARGGAA